LSVSLHYRLSYRQQRNRHRAIDKRTGVKIRQEPAIALAAAIRTIVALAAAIRTIVALAAAIPTTVTRLNPRKF
jgi:hypothetical protein